MPIPPPETAIRALQPLVEFAFAKIKYPIEVPANAVQAYKPLVEGFPESLDSGEYAVRLYHALCLRTPCECWQRVLELEDQQKLWADPTQADIDPATNLPRILAVAGSVTRAAEAKYQACMQFHRYPVGDYTLRSKDGAKTILSLDEFHQIVVCGRKLETKRERTLELKKFGPSLLSSILAEEIGLRRRNVALLVCPACRGEFFTYSLDKGGLPICQHCKNSCDPTTGGVLIRKLKDHWILDPADDDVDDLDTRAFQLAFVWHCGIEECDNHFPFPRQLGANAPYPPPEAKCPCGGTNRSRSRLWFFVPPAPTSHYLGGATLATFAQRFEEIIRELVHAPEEIINLIETFLLADILNVRERLRLPDGEFDWVLLHRCALASNNDMRFRLLVLDDISAADRQGLLKAQWNNRLYFGRAEGASMEALEHSWTNCWDGELFNVCKSFLVERQSATSGQQTDEPKDE